MIPCLGHQKEVIHFYFYKLLEYNPLLVSTYAIMEEGIFQQSFSCFARLDSKNLDCQFTCQLHFQRTVYSMQ